MSIYLRAQRLQFRDLLDAETVLVDFDVSKNETHDHSVRVTEHPIESDEDASDHIVIEPVTLSLQAYISNTPIKQALSTIVGAASQLSGTNAADAPIPDDAKRAELAYEALIRLKEAGTLFTVLTSLREYRNMVIKSMTVDRSSETGNVLSVAIVAREIRVVASKTIAAPRASAGARPSVEKGRRQTAEAAPAIEERSRSLLLRLTGDTGAVQSALGVP